MGGSAVTLGLVNSVVYYRNGNAVPRNFRPQTAHNIPVCKQVIDY